MSKEEILAQYGYTNLDYDTQRALTLSMEEYAKQEAIAFAEWASGHGFDYKGEKWQKWEQTDYKSKSLVSRTTEQLYNLYLQSKSKEV